ncbi:hypothetical protein [Streptomyces sp. NPDC012510]|uniref:hypothetical protein n=1 Tax=Streptomyces sp. NPDC012510 TaxID=3364838 RepID=UPI0036F1595C
MRFIGFYRQLEDRTVSTYTEEIPLPDSGALSYPLHDLTQYLLSGHPVLDVTELTADVIGDAFRVPGGSSVLTDGSFVWRLDLASYVRHYSIALPEDFLSFAEAHGYQVPSVERELLLDISLQVGRTLGFRSDPGAGPQSGRSQ